MHLSVPVLVGMAESHVISGASICRGVKSVIRYATPPPNLKIQPLAMDPDVRPNGNAVIGQR